MAIVLFMGVSNSSAQVFGVDWSVSGLEYDGDVFTSINLDLELLNRFVGVNGIINHTNDLFFRPVDGTCLPDLTGDIVCELRLDAITLSLRIGSELNGSATLFDTQTGIEIDRGVIFVTNVQ